MTKSSGEMPFLDHLEELRFRILRALLAVIVGVGIGLWATIHFNLILFISKPIAPFLADHKLVIHGVTDQVMVALKIGAFFGLVLAAPVVLYQVWAFLSPALYAREKKAMIPAMGAGLVLFLIGGGIGWYYVVPMGLDFLMNFLPNTFNPLITTDEYFSFVLQVILAFGISFELPLLMILLAWIGIMSYKKYNTFRRYAILVNFFLGAILSPGTDVFSMIVFTIPLLVLYELGVAGAYIVARRKRLRDAAVAGIVLLALCGLPQGLHAQVPSKPPTSGRAPPVVQDTTRRAPITRTVDSAAAKRLGLPDKPTVIFPSPDSIAQALLNRKGFGITEMVGDSAVLSPDGPKFLIHGGGIRRDTSIFEAHLLRYDNVTCELVGSGEPHLFQGVPPRPLVGRITTINTCQERVVVSDAFTSVDEMGGNWYLRGNFAIDSSGSRFYMAHGEFTSCDLPIPDYHFTASQVKWVANAIIVARPAVLYVRDVPLVWLPFIFQDTKSKRSSGILIPRFGFNDIVRPERTYNRAITNLGYYWAPNDYIDLTAKFDWYANRYLAYGANLRYNWRNRFLDGDFAYSKQVQDNGTNGLTLGWTHTQRFNIATSISLSFNYVSNATVVQNNAIDPLLNTASIRSSLNFTKRLRWGNITLGGNRSESITDGSGTMTLPSLSISPHDFALSRLITWSPNLQINNELQFKQPIVPGLILGNGSLDTSRTTGHSRRTTVTLPTPLRIGQFMLNNNITLNDVQLVGRVTRTIRRPDSTTADPNDSVTVLLTREGSFTSGIDFNTGVNLPQLLRNSWKVTPTVGITNIVVNYPLFYRSEATNGKWVTQGKKLQFRLAAAPNFYALTRGAFGPAARLRYALSPQLSFDYAPKATLPSEFAKALTDGGLQTTTATPAAMTASIQLSQNFQAKPHRAPGDTLSAESTARPVTVLSINTSSVGYDFEQAKLPGRSGWTTATINNTLGSDLLPGFSLSIGHDLWKGQVGSDTARFSPYLSNVAANFSFSGRTFNGLARLLGLASRAAAPGPAAPMSTTQVPSRQGMFGSSSNGLPPAMGRTGFSASINYTLNRPRPNAGITVPSVPEDPFGRPPIIQPIVTNSQSSIGLNMSFSPTRYWAARWQTQYNATAKRFESQQIQLERTLHDWRATFNFTKNANGNYALVFSIVLMRLTDIKFDYQQQTIQP